MLIADTTTEQGIIHYLESIKSVDINNVNLSLNSIEKDDVVVYEKISIKQQNNVTSDISNDEEFSVEINYYITKKIIGFRLIFLLYDNYENLISKSFFDELNDMGSTVEEGCYQTIFNIPANLLIDGTYKVKIISYIHNVRMCKPYEGISINLNVIETGSLKRKVLPPNDKGLVTLPTKIATQKTI